MQVRHADLGKVVSGDRLRAGEQPGRLEGGGLVGVVLDADDPALPHGQHLPEPLLVGLVALLVTPVGRTSRMTLSPASMGSPKSARTPWSYWRRKVSRTCSRSWQSHGPGWAASDAVTAGALVGGLQEVEVRLRLLPTGGLVSSGGCGGGQ